MIDCTKNIIHYLENILEMNSYEKKMSPQELGIDENAKLHEIRCKADTRIGILSIVMIFTGVASVALGVAIVTLGKGGKNPTTSGFPITSGFLVLAAGCSALAFSCMEPSPTDDKRKSRQRALMNAFYYQSIGATPPTGMAIGYTIWGAVACGQDNTSICGMELDAMLAVNITCIFLACINFGALITVHVFYHMYRKAFGICGGCCGRKC